jgi:hypothetical protein
MGSNGLLSSGSNGVSSLAGVLTGVLAVVVILAIVGIFVIIVVANRAEPDPNGRRPFTVYLFGVSFITLWTAVIGSIGVVTSLVRLIGTTTSSGPGIHPVGDAVARNVVLSGLVLLVSLAILVTHLRRGLEYARAEGRPTGAAGPSGRVAQTYVAAIAFVAILILVVTVIVTVYTLFQIAAPGVFAPSRGRVGSAKSLIDSAYITIVLLVVLGVHRGMVAPGIQVLDGWKRRKAPASPESPPPA